MYNTHKHIIEMINQNIKEEERILLSIYSILIKISSQEPMAYTTALDDLYMDYKFKALIEKKWGSNVLGDSSFEKLTQFEKKWLDYRRENTFGEDEIFVYLDPNWHQIRETYLWPSIDSLKRDFNKNIADSNLDRTTIENKRRPTDAEILERGKILYGMLIKNGIIDKSYID